MDKMRETWCFQHSTFLALCKAVVIIQIVYRQMRILNSHVNLVLGSLGNGGPNRLQRFIDGWFHTTERCNAPSRPINPEGSNTTGERPATCSTTSCLGTRQRNRDLSSSQPQLVLPINLNRMPFSSSNELPTNVNFGGYRYRLAGVSFRMMEPNGRRWTSRIMHLGQSFYHSADSFESQRYHADPLNSALSFAYYVIDTGDYITF
ncbi:uncharacterized protein LOC134276863 [Saccostrea cucullata]|uniref:uncharacterized protein LOC134276863 n=1 Tax=Saccostrea cuccullata TaxID=36930 RepID=UPI002ECFE8B9